MNKGAMYVIIAMLMITSVMAGIQQQATPDGKVIINIRPGDSVSLADLEEGNTVAVRSDQENAKLQIQVTGDVQEITNYPELMTLGTANTWTKPDITFSVSEQGIIGGKYTGAVKIIELNDCEGCNINNQLAVKKYIEVNIAQQTTGSAYNNEEIVQTMPEEDEEANKKLFFQIGGLFAGLALLFVLWKAVWN